MSIKFPAHGDITKLFPDGQVGLHDIMILKKISEKCTDTDFGHKPMSRKEWTEWIPTDEDVPSLVESIKFWRSCYPKRHKRDWGMLDHELFAESLKKEIICIDLLQKVPSMSMKNFYKRFNKRQHQIRKGTF